MCDKYSSAPIGLVGISIYQSYFAGGDKNC